MKKIGAISLLFILLFNAVGYRLLLNYLRALDDKAFQVSIDNNQYNPDDLVTIKIPLNLPYQTNWKDFERIDGAVQFNGVTYKYVKRRVYNGQLVLLCLPYDQSNRFETARNDFFKIANDLANMPGSKKPVSSPVAKVFFSIYDKCDNQWHTQYFLSSTTYNKPHNAKATSLYSPCLPGKPPRYALS